MGLALVAALCSSLPSHAAEQPADVIRGEHIATAIAHCTECHGVDLGGGRSFAARAGGTRFVASNLTAGTGGVGTTYSDADYARAIRQGVRPDGSALAAVMPSSNFAVLADRDVVSLVAYIRSLPPVDRGSSQPTARVATPSAAAESGVPMPTAQTEGAYLARLGGCLSCHGTDLHGQTGHNFVAPDISHGGLGTWTAADFTTAMRSGRTPDGRTLHAPMPWPAIGRLTDPELAALYDYLEAAPARL